MTINPDALINQTLLSTLSAPKSASTTDFQAELQRQLIDNLQAQKKPTEKQTDAQVEEFKRELTSIGALAFMQEHNLQKIEELVEKKRAELKESLGLNNTTTPLSEKELKSTLETLEAMLSDYKKELLEKAQAQEKLDKNNAILSSLLQKF